MSTVVKKFTRLNPKGTILMIGLTLSYVSMLITASFSISYRDRLERMGAIVYGEWFIYTISVIGLIGAVTMLAVTLQSEKLTDTIEVEIEEPEPLAYIHKREILQLNDDPQHNRDNNHNTSYDTSHKHVNEETHTNDSVTSENRAQDQDKDSTKEITNPSSVSDGNDVSADQIDSDVVADEDENEAQGKLF